MLSRNRSMPTLAIERPRFRVSMLTRARAWHPTAPYALQALAHG